MTYSSSPSIELPLREAYPFASAHGLGSQAERIRKTSPAASTHESVFRRGLMADLLRRHDLLGKFISECWPHGATLAGQSLLARYQPVSHRSTDSVAPPPRRSAQVVNMPPVSQDTNTVVAPAAPSGQGQATRLAIFVRGMAMFKGRRVAKTLQEDLLRRHLPNTVSFVGAFNKSGNFAVVSGTRLNIVGQVVLDALRRNEKLSDLSASHITVLPASTVGAELDALVRSLTSCYGDHFDPKSLGVQLERHVWRAGLTFLPEPLAITAFAWPNEAEPTVRVLAGSGQIVQFLKREEGDDEERISFGDPTRAVDAALREHLGRDIRTTSRSGGTIRGLLRKFRYVLRSRTRGVIGAEP